jgi:carbon-monoxide dehydrogenase small subunit
MNDSGLPPQEQREITVCVNGTPRTARVETRWLLSDFLRHTLNLTGTHVGCEHGVCGACTVIFNGTPIRSCLMFAVQADGGELLTVEGLAESNGMLHPIQQALHDHHGLQCGFCTPGFLMSIYALLQDNHASNISDEELRAALAGNLCRCTGYQGIVAAVRHLLNSPSAETDLACPEESHNKLNGGHDKSVPAETHLAEEEKAV